MVALSEADRLHVGAAVAPTIRRGGGGKISVVDGCGRVVRTISAGELLQAVSARAGIEIDRLPSPTRCPSCPGAKAEAAAMCVECAKRKRPRRRPTGIGNALDQETVTSICLLAADGVPKREIARRIGVSQDTVRAYVGPTDKAAAMRWHHAKRKAEGRPIVPPRQGVRG